ncbi:MAG: type III pantothenate kinase [Gammaproteobacteria bacterium]|nr:type III pantothenate kinase [Gammaproteobacteria bacterium]
MRLVIDIGNTRIKAALEDAGSLQLLGACAWRGEALDSILARALEQAARPGEILVANVGGAAVADALTGFCEARWGLAPRFMRVQRECAGMTTHYDDPSRLGVDRWLAALAAWVETLGPVCVVDAGTALTVDVVTGQGDHRGGLIAPGLALMARSLTQGTAQLDIDHLEPVAHFATNTRQGISLGCRDAVAGLLERVAARWKNELGVQPRWFLTGGEAAQVQEICSFSLEIVPDLVHRGILAAAEAG